MNDKVAAAVELVAKWRRAIVKPEQNRFRSIRSDYRAGYNDALDICADGLEEILAELGSGAVGGNHIDALKAAYRKHTLDDDSIGWNQLSGIICNAICNEIGDKAFQKWLSEVSK